MVGKVAAGLVLASIAVGCSNSNKSVARTPAERTMQTSRALEQQAKMMKKGEGMVVDGRAQRERGVAMKEQGRGVEGEQQIAKGDGKVQQGQAMVDRARVQRDQILRQAQSGDAASQGRYEKTEPSTTEKTAE